MTYCGKCGTQLSDGANFCPKCGNPCGNSSSQPTEEVSVAGQSKKNKSVKVILATGLAICIIGGGLLIWQKYGNEKAEDNVLQEKEELVLQEKKELPVKINQEEIEQQEQVQFLEIFYKKLNYSEWEELDNYVRKNVTSNALQTLRDEYDYECDDGDCLALWMFSYEAGDDTDKLIERKIEALSENTFLVTNTWGYSDGPAARFDYKVRLGIVKEGDSYKIDTIVKVEEEEQEKVSRENSNQYSKYVGRWILRKRTDEGRKMIIEVKLKENHNGELACFHDRGNVDDVIAYEVYAQCILSDGVIYMTKDGDINGRGVPKLRVGSDGLYSFDGEKYERQSE